jgi:hypothetical protein
MKKTALLLAIYAFISLSACNTTSGDAPVLTTQTTTETLVTNPWKIEKITDTNGSTINPSSLPAESRALFSVNIQFNNDKTVRAIDPVARTIVNGGKWDLLDVNNVKLLDIDISQLKGQFPIVSIKKERMVLKNTTSINGFSFEYNLELVPVL